MKTELYRTLFHPKVINIQEPGRIVSAISDYYGRPFQRKRMVYVFEAPFTNLMIDTQKVLGKDAANDLFYKIGKDIAYRYMIIAQAQKVTGKSLEASLKAVFENLKKFGFTIGSEIHFDEKKKTLRMRGKDNIFCSRSGVSGFTAGVISGFLSFLIGENIEAESTSCSYQSDFCEVTAHPGIGEKYVPNIEEVKPSSKYKLYNFDTKAKSLKKELPTFDDLIAFQKISISKEGKIMMDDEQITILEIGCFGLIAHNFYKIKQSRLIQDSLLKSNANLMRKMVKSDTTQEQKLDFMRKLLSAFGWGTPRTLIKGTSLVVSIEEFPWSRFEPDYMVYSINGMVNGIFGKEMKIGKISTQAGLTRISFI